MTLYYITCQNVAKNLYCAFTSENHIISVHLIMENVSIFHSLNYVENKNKIITVEYFPVMYSFYRVISKLFPRFMKLPSKGSAAGIKTLNDGNVDNCYSYIYSESA